MKKFLFQASILLLLITKSFAQEVDIEEVKAYKITYNNTISFTMVDERIIYNSAYFNCGENGLIFFNLGTRKDGMSFTGDLNFTVFKKKIKNPENYTYKVENFSSGFLNYSYCYSAELNTIYILLDYKSSKDKIVTYNLETNDFYKYDISSASEKLFEVASIDGKAYTLISKSNQNILVELNNSEIKSITLPGFFDDKLINSIVSVSKNENLICYASKANKLLNDNFALVNDEFKIIENALFPSNESIFKINNYSATKAENNLMIIGSYCLNTKKNYSGIFVSKISKNKTSYFEKYPFKDFNKFFDYGGKIKEKLIAQANKNEFKYTETPAFQKPLFQNDKLILNIEFPLFKFNHYYLKSETNVNLKNLLILEIDNANGALLENQTFQREDENQMYHISEDSLGYIWYSVSNHEKYSYFNYTSGELSKTEEYSFNKIAYNRKEDKTIIISNLEKWYGNFFFAETMIEKDGEFINYLMQFEVNY